MKDVAIFTIKNLNKEKLFKEIIKICDIQDIEINSDILKFSVNYKYKKKVLKLLENKYIKTLEIKRKGPINYLKNSIFRIGVIIPIILFSIFLFISNFFVFNYEIQGIELINKNEIIEILEKNNINGIIKKSSIDKTKLENEIQTLDKVSLVSVIIRGNSLVINVKEKVYNKEYEDKENFQPLCSNFNGTITEISVVQGTPLVKVGQTVRVGQELVAPYVMDTSGALMGVLPMADIKADVYYTTITEVSDTFIEMVDTGEYFTNKRVSMCGMTVSENSKTCNYKYFRTETKEEHLTKNVLLPTKVEYTTYYEQQEVITEDYFNTNKSSILEDCKQKTRQQLDFYDIIKEEYHTITSVAGINTITYTMVVNKSIC